ncbi:MAG: hypothetical protein PHG25_03840 [Candidatus Pacebacteria bacterium]|nr:hypothetical protein [Candidatus Paceibacterota bacterium]
MNRSVIFRILLDIALFICVIHGWWFIALPIVFIGVLRLYFVVEIIVAGIMYDALFGMVVPAGIWGYAGIITAAVILIILRLLKKVVR